MSLITTRALLSIPTRAIRRRDDPNTPFFICETVIVDTGSTRTILPMEAAKTMGVRLSEPEAVPTAFGGHSIEAMVGTIRVELPDFRVSAVVEAFFADSKEVLVGTDFLSRVGATLTIGKRKIGFARKNPDEEDFVTVLWDYSDEDLE